MSNGLTAPGCKPEAPTPKGWGKARSAAAGRFPCLTDITGRAYKYQDFPLVLEEDFGNSYLVKVIPEAGRGVIVNMPASSHRGGNWTRLETERGSQLVEVDYETGEVLRECRDKSDFERDEDNHRRETRRAKNGLSDYVVANSLSVMWTLTYGGPNRPGAHERSRAKRDVNAFMKAWRADARWKFPYAYVLEEHKDGHLHVHIAVPEFFFSWRRLGQLWGRGHVEFERRADSGTARGLRRHGNYLAKYFAKQFGEYDNKGQHRYEVAQGFSPQSISVRVGTVKASFVKMMELFEGFELLEIVWTSNDDVDFEGPPVWCVVAT